MARKRKKAGGQGDDAAPVAKPPPKVATQLGALLTQAGIKPASPKAASPKAGRGSARGPQTLPPPVAEPVRVTERPSAGIAARAAEGGTITGSELRMLNDAYAGARPIGDKTARRRPVALASERRAVLAQDHSDELAARARLDALVAGGVRFNVQRDEGFVHGLRADASPKLLARLAGKGFVAEATLDLHGRRAAEVARLVSEFVRSSHRSGARSLLIITGKGLHSEGGAGVLGLAVADALVQGGAAPLVQAFASAHVNRGGSGAIAVLLQG
ncbi:MAG TPA: Smr/MutS family protein [Polyangiales bacterium]